MIARVSLVPFKDFVSFVFRRLLKLGELYEQRAKFNKSVQTSLFRFKTCRPPLNFMEFSLLHSLQMPTLAITSISIRFGGGHFKKMECVDTLEKFLRFTLGQNTLFCLNEFPNSITSLAFQTLCHKPEDFLLLLNSDTNWVAPCR